jgi:hypothetical protein
LLGVRAQDNADNGSDPSSASSTTGGAAVHNVVIKMATELKDDDGLQLMSPSTDFNADTPKIYATVGMDPGPEIDFTARIIAEDVVGKAAGETVVDSDQINGGAVRPDTPVGTLTVNLTEDGLWPGRYRLEVIEVETKRLIGAVKFTSHPRPLPSADAFTVNLTESDQDDSASPPTVDFPTFPQGFIVTVASSVGFRSDVYAWVVAREVMAFPKDRVVMRLPNLSGVAFGPDQDVTKFVFAVPNMGFPPGKYRFEMRTVATPHSVVCEKDFTAHDLDSSAVSFNLADNNWGGQIESVSGEDGTGLSSASLLLVSGNTQSWQPYAAQIAKDGDPVNWFPTEFTISFFNHQSAKVGAVELVAADDQHEVRQVEIWASNDSPTDSFTKVASVENTGTDLNYTIPIPPTDAKYIRVKILSAQSDDSVLRLNEIRVREAAAAGYVPLRQRAPAMDEWRYQPHYAAQRGLDFLQPSAVTWQRENNCLGCHVQSQALMGISIARANDYRVSGRAEEILSQFISHLQHEGGSFTRTDTDDAGEVSTSDFAAMGMAYTKRTPVRDQAVTNAARWLLTIQTDDGAVHGDDSRAPIEQGELMFTTNALKVWHEALALANNAEFQTAFAKGLAYIEGAETSTTQDKAFQILGLSWFGNTAQKSKARELAVKLQTLQQADGGWLLEDEPQPASSCFATGQVLFALKTAGVSPNSAAFRRGVMFLLIQQHRDGSWADPELSTPFAATMWPVIALTGAFAHRDEPGHITVSALPRKPKTVPLTEAKPTPTPAPKATSQTIEFVLDCSYSMNQYIGATGLTRLRTAKTVLHEIISRLPADTNVGLRFYGHRYMSFSGKSSHDTELVVPIQPLNRDLLNKTIAAVEAKGQTPLVYSTLQAGDDLAKIGGGSIILVTDGEESCGGNPRKAGPELAALKAPVHLDIVGFTLTGKRVTADLVAFTAATGGHYYTAADGLQLTAALSSTIAPTTHAAPIAAPVPPPPAESIFENFAYEILNGKNEKVFSSSIQTSDTPDLPEGDYIVDLHDGQKVVASDPIKLKTGESVEIRYDPNLGAFAQVPQ